MRVFTLQHLTPCINSRQESLKGGWNILRYLVFPDIHTTQIATVCRVMGCVLSWAKRKNRGRSQNQLLPPYRRDWFQKRNCDGTMKILLSANWLVEHKAVHCYACLHCHCTKTLFPQKFTPSRRKENNHFNEEKTYISVILNGPHSNRIHWLIDLSLTFTSTT